MARHQFKSSLPPDYVPDAASIERSRLRRAETKIHVARFIDSVGAHVDTAGVRYNLSPLHALHGPDLCWVYAGANLFGLGAGCYPLDNHPWPVFEGDISYHTAIFKDEVTHEDRRRISAVQWLQRQPREVAAAILGEALLQRLDTGQLSDLELVAPVSGFRPPISEAELRSW